VSLVLAYSLGGAYRVVLTEELAAHSTHGSGPTAGYYLYDGTCPQLGYYCTPGTGPYSG